MQRKKFQTEKNVPYSLLRHFAYTYMHINIYFLSCLHSFMVLIQISCSSRYHLKQQQVLTLSKQKSTQVHMKTNTPIHSSTLLNLINKAKILVIFFSQKNIHVYLCGWVCARLTWQSWVSCYILYDSDNVYVSRHTRYNLIRPKNHRVFFFCKRKHAQ